MKTDMNYYAFRDCSLQPGNVKILPNMDFKYLIWNYQAKRLHFPRIRKIWSNQNMTADF